jgi:SRSO17 transposase
VRELAFYRCAGPAATPLPELIRVAGARCAIEECFQTAKNEAGLDHYQVRSFRAWYARRPQPDPPVDQRHPPTPRRPRTHPADLQTTLMHWSRWRRERQHQARTCHYRRRGERPPD